MNASQIISSIKRYIAYLCTQQGRKKGIIILLILLYILNKLRRHFGLCKQKSLVGETVFLTGGGMGIGRLVAFRLARLGAKVVIADIRAEDAERVAAAIRSEKKQAISVQCDVGDKNSVHAAAELARQQFGPVTMLINNAGIVVGKLFKDATVEEMEKVIRVNLTAHIITIKEFLPSMLERNHGHIVTIASAAGLIGVPYLADYCAAKFGDVGLDEALRYELAHLGTKIKTTCINPYFINTGMFKGVKGTWIAPMLEEQYVASRIVQAIRQEEESVNLPTIVNLVPLLRGLLPVWLFDFAGKIIGNNQVMAGFQGRQATIAPRSVA